MGITAFGYVAAGGALGASLRYGLGVVAGGLGPQSFPVAVLIANILGSFAMGALLGAFLSREGGEALRLFLMTGLLGGFTTFSAFSAEALGLVTKGAWGLACLYVGLSVVGALGAVALGWALAKGLGG